MRKNPIILFFICVAILILGATLYIQSATFANQLKRALEKYIPKNLGISGDFSNITIQIYPPGVGIVNPRIEASERNAAGIPAGTRIEAEKMEVSFRPIQILSGRVSIHEVKIINGKVKTKLIAKADTAKKKKTSGLSWQDLVDIQTDRIALENTAVELEIPSLKTKTKFNAKSVEIEKINEKDESFYDIAVHLGEFQAETPSSFPYPKTLDSLRISARAGAGGVQLRDFELVREGTQASASGTVKGDLLSGSGLKADLALKLQGDLARMLDFLSHGKTGSEVPQGHVTFDGRAQMELDRVPETLSATGVLKSEKFTFRNYRFDQAEVEGSYSAHGNTSGAADDIIVKKAVLESAEIEKSNGKPGLGGRVEVGAFKYNLSKPAPIETTIKLKRAHVLWIGAELLKELFPLDGRITGETKIKFSPPANTNPLDIHAEVDWKVEGLQIDNQRLGENKKLNRIIHLKEVSLKGPVSVNASAVKFENLSLGMKNSRLTVEGEIGIAPGKKTTYEILGGGPVDFKEFGILAENPIEGSGALAIHVHGNSDSVKLDFDGSIKEFKYLSLNFGEFRGRVTWDDEPSQLLFQNLECNQGHTRYRLNGKMDLGLKESMDFNVDVPEGGNINDFLSIFDSFTKEFWWFPKTITGGMKAQMRVYGGISLSQMMVDASITGNRWEYFGERFSKVKISGGYDRGKYFISDFEGMKRQGRIYGNISFDAKSNYDWKISTDSFSVSDVDHLASLDIPLRGAVSGTSVGKGPQGSVESKTELRLSNLAIRGNRYEDSALLVETKNGRARVEGNGIGNQASLKALYDFNVGKESYFEVKANDLDFSPMILLLNPSLMQDENLVGRISGNYRLEFLSGQAEVGTGQARFSDYTLRKTGTSFNLDHPIDFKIEKGSFSIPGLELVGDEGATLFSMKSNSGNLSGKIRGNIDLSIAEFFTSAVQKSDGVVEVDLDISGSLKAPQIAGSGNVEGGVIRITGIETPIENINGPFALEEGLLSLDGIESDLASARATLDGSLNFFVTKWPTLDLSIGLNGNKLKFYPFQVAKVRGRVEVKGESRPYLVGGKIILENAISREKIANVRGPGLRTVQYLPPASSNSSTVTQLLKLDIGVTAPGNIIIQNELMDLEAKGDLRITGNIDNPIPMGTGSAVQGKILFKDRSFQIQTGMMEFDNPTAINPRFEVLSFAEIANRRIQLFATGRFDNQKFEFSSNPPMPEPEILNLLALGVTGDETRKFRSSDRSAYEQGEAASLVLHSLDFNREVQAKTGLQIGINEAVDDRTGTSVFSRATATDAGTAPKIVIKRQFGKRFGVSAGSTVGVGTSIQREVNAEVNVTNGLSVIGVWDSIEGATAEDPKRNSFGLDLKLQRRFK